MTSAKLLVLVFATVMVPTFAHAYSPYDDCDEYEGECDFDSDPYDDGYTETAYTHFESQLSPYGQWVVTAGYGRVWVPSVTIVGSSFSPYHTGGHWVWTDYGWTWVSDWAWGWAPFHYGRWVTAGAFGWCWVPGTVWGPAWVDWRYGNGYVGWAPLPPRGVVIGPPIGARSPWRFVGAPELGRRNPSFVAPHLVPGVFARTNVVHNPRTVAFGNGVSGRFNVGPTVGGAVVGPPSRLSQIAPAVMPRTQIAPPRTPLPLQQRPWVQARANVVSPARPVGFVTPPRTMPSTSMGSPSVYAPRSPGATLPNRGATFADRPAMTLPNRGATFADRPATTLPNRGATFGAPPAVQAPARPMPAPNYHGGGFTPRPAPSYNNNAGAIAPRPAPGYGGGGSYAAPSGGSLAPSRPAPSFGGGMSSPRPAPGYGGGGSFSAPRSYGGGGTFAAPPGGSFGGGGARPNVGAPSMGRGGFR